MDAIDNRVNGCGCRPPWNGHGSVVATRNNETPAGWRSGGRDSLPQKRDQLELTEHRLRIRP